MTTWLSICIVNKVIISSTIYFFKILNVNFLHFSHNFSSIWRWLQGPQSDLFHHIIRDKIQISTVAAVLSHKKTAHLNFFESVVFLLICSESCVVREWHKFEDDFQIFPSYISVHSFVSIRRLLLGTHPSDFVRNGSFLCAYIPENGFYLSGDFFFVPGISATLRISSLLSTGR